MVNELTDVACEVGYGTRRTNLAMSDTPKTG